MEHVIVGQEPAAVDERGVPPCSHASANGTHEVDGLVGEPGEPPEGGRGVERDDRVGTRLEECGDQAGVPGYWGTCATEQLGTVCDEISSPDATGHRAAVETEVTGLRSEHEAVLSSQEFG